MPREIKDIKAVRLYHSSAGQPLALRYFGDSNTNELSSSLRLPDARMLHVRFHYVRFYGISWLRNREIVGEITTAGSVWKNQN